MCWTTCMTPSLLIATAKLALNCYQAGERLRTLNNAARPKTDELKHAETHGPEQAEEERPAQDATHIAHESSVPDAQESDQALQKRMGTVESGWSAEHEYLDERTM